VTGGIPHGFAARLTAQLPALRRYATALCGNQALADDLVQDGIERALTRAASLQQPERVGAWLRRIVHNLYVDEIRRRQARGTPVDVADLANDVALSTIDPDRSAPNDVARAMALLSVEHRQILVLAGVEELTYREIADELGMPLGTVMSRLARARAALRARLEPGTATAQAAAEPGG
jgi:RNA polymerase sigma-70 factor (ECF subfamily)